MKEILATKKTNIERRYIRFGIFILNHHKLKSNVLLIKYPTSFAPVPKIRSTVISDTFKDLLHDLMDTQTINTAVQKKLSKKEADTFELLIRLAKLTEQLNYERQEMTVDDHISRFDILRGEMIAGNDSRILKDELIELVDILNKAGKIDDADKNDFIEILIK
jgi:hypothetical protein